MSHQSHKSQGKAENNFLALSCARGYKRRSNQNGKRYGGEKWQIKTRKAEPMNLGATGSRKLLPQSPSKPCNYSWIQNVANPQQNGYIKKVLKLSELHFLPATTEILV